MMYSHLNNLLQKNKPIQLVLGVLSLILMLLYIFTFYMDLSSTYYSIANNDEIIKTDYESEYILEYEVDALNHYKMTTVDNKVIEKDNVTLAFSHKVDKAKCRYNEGSNTLVVRLDDSFKLNFLMAENYFVVLFVSIFVSCLYFIANKYKNFTVLSNKRLLICSFFVTISIVIEGVLAYCLL